MQKRILVIEESDTIRNVAETILRQHGYDVISVGSSERALELLEFSLPHLILASADLKGSDGRPCYEKIQSDYRTTSVPMILMAGEDSPDLPFPEEAVVRRPFDPDQLIRRVSIFAGAADLAPAGLTKNSHAEEELDNEFLDAALGLDDINVTSSEVLDKTGNVKGAMSASGRTITPGEDDSQGSKVESLMIHDESSDIKHEPTRPKEQKVGSSSAKLEIMEDQYGLNDPRAFENLDGDQAHDYDWFVNSMRAENQTATPGSGAPVGQRPDELDHLNFTDNASHIDPITPGPGKPASGTSGNPMSPTARHTAGVDKFIDEFKKEIEKIRAADQDVAIDDAGGQMSGQDAGAIVWEEKVEKITPEHIELFTREFIALLAEKIADRIAEKIDSEKLLQLIKNEIAVRTRKKS